MTTTGTSIVAARAGTRHYSDSARIQRALRCAEHTWGARSWWWALVEGWVAGILIGVVVGYFLNLRGWGLLDEWGFWAVGAGLGALCLFIWRLRYLQLLNGTRDGTYWGYGRVDRSALLASLTLNQSQRMDGAQGDALINRWATPDDCTLSTHVARLLSRAARTLEPRDGLCQLYDEFERVGTRCSGLLDLCDLAWRIEIIEHSLLAKDARSVTLPVSALWRGLNQVADLIGECSEGELVRASTLVAIAAAGYTEGDEQGCLDLYDVVARNIRQLRGVA